jgi:hypothetical protein
VKNPPTDSTFGRDLLAACPLVRAARPREGESRVQVYAGVQLIQSDEQMAANLNRGLKD